MGEVGFKVGDKVDYLNGEYVIHKITDHYILRSTSDNTSVPFVHIDFTRGSELKLVMDPVRRQCSSQPVGAGGKKGKRMNMADNKSYMVDISLELVTDDDEKVKAVRIRDMKHRPLPLSLAVDFFDRIRMMTPGEPVVCMASANPRDPLVENGKMYVLKYSDCQFQSGDYFKAFGDRFLQHVRSGEVVEVTEGNVAGFVCCGDSQAFTNVPASPEEVAFTDRIIEKIKNIKDGGQ